jgi:uncharacterized membrane protein YhaH (DUF805 family)
MRIWVRGSGGRARRRSIWFWVLVAVLVILLLGLFFGGYRKGTRVSGLGSPQVADSAVIVSRPPSVDERFASLC